MQNKRVDCVASRHENRVRRATNYANTTNTSNNEGNEDARGNVAFADGHGEFFSRKDAMRGRYSGSAVPDPTGY
jgi:prepilin-type processing-associated H-X9-DG protein